MQHGGARNTLTIGALFLSLFGFGVIGCDGALSAVLGVLGDGVTIVIERPTDCFQEDVVATDCFTQETLVTFCEEDFFGNEVCFDELILELVCEDVVIDSFLICE